MNLINTDNLSTLCLNIKQVCDQFTFYREEVILLYGYTGEGKTTLLNCMAQKPMRGIKVPMVGFKFQIDNPIQGTKASGGIVAQTSIPFFYDKICDTQGLGDTRGAIQEIINAFSIHSIVKNTKQIKILLIVSEQTLTEPRSQKLLKLILNLSSTFQNTDELIEGLCLVVTQTQEQDSDEVRFVFSEILEEEIECTAQKRILQYFASMESKIVFFRSPTNENENTTNEDRKLILGEADKLKYIVNPEPRITLSLDSNSFLLNYLEIVYNDVANLIQNKLTLGIKIYLEESIQNHRCLLVDLRSQLTYLHDQLSQIKSRPNVLNSVDEFYGNIQKVLSISIIIKSLDVQREIEQIISTLEFINSIKSSELQIHGNTKFWYCYIESTLKQLQTLISPPNISINELLGIVNIGGPLVGVDDIQNCIQKYKDFSKINIICSNSLFIDGDIIMQGKDLNLNTPNLIIVGKRQINLMGLASENHQVEKAFNGEQNPNTEYLSRQGSVGRIGMPGSNGGNLDIMAVNAINLDSLMIDVGGGNGGQGQNGGDGARGLDGQNQGKEDVQGRKDSALISRKNAKRDSFKSYITYAARKMFFQKQKQEEIYQSCTPGQKGGEAGLGGKGGNAGQPGVVNIDICIQDELRPLIQNSLGQSGEDGQDGYTGVEGNNGPTYYGIYIKSSSYTSKWKKKPELLDNDVLGEIVSNIVNTLEQGEVVVQY